MSGFFCFIANDAMNIRAVIFDLDGTLVDTAGEIALALNATLAQLNLPELPQQDIETLIGRGVRSMVERAVARVGGAAIDLDAAVERFEDRYTRTVGTKARLFPGVREGLSLFHASGFKLAVVTNKPRSFTERLLACLEVDPLFSAIVAGDDGIRGKPHGDMLVAACLAGTTKGGARQRSSATGWWRRWKRPRGCCSLHALDDERDSLTHADAHRA